MPETWTHPTRGIAGMHEFPSRLTFMSEAREEVAA
jgi:hypothetical protein